jgi:hypothetical protein
MSSGDFIQNHRGNTKLETAHRDFGEHLADPNNHQQNGHDNRVEHPTRKYDSIILKTVANIRNSIELFEKSIKHPKQSETDREELKIS